ncbi:unnamed protein product [Phytomonas sp. EM1]|nr:unnamed protein product [Phytomonas sp. EM1]|eukprot:CCW61132.1 unnamed protein product [Phytomonas sp. isolate EM1]
MRAKENQNRSGVHTGHICVALRVRPLLVNEADRGETEVITIIPVKQSSPSCSLAESFPIDRSPRRHLATPPAAFKQTNQAKSLLLQQSQSSEKEIDKKKEKNYSSKGGAHYAAQVHLSATYQRQKVHPQTSSIGQLRDSEPTSEVFAFDAVLGPGATQTDVFDLLQLYTYCDDAMLEGKAAAIVCYGQTGSGKSFTMSGPLAAPNGDHGVNSELQRDDFQQDVGGGRRGAVLIEESGVAYQAVLYIADCLKKMQQSTHSDSGLRLVARASYMELYQERIHDLLQGQRDLRCRWSAERRAFYVEDLLQVECRTKEDFLLVLREGQSRRQQAGHMLNATSSRSHALFTINFETTTAHSRTETTHCGSYTRYGKLTLVDLAGSERLKDTGNAASDDTKAINRSLFALSNVIQALSLAEPMNNGTSSKKKNPSVLSGKRTGSSCSINSTNDTSPNENAKAGLHKGSFVSYRSSVLTKLLMDSLEGNSRTLFIICVTPSSRFVDESLRTLHFAQRVRQIRSVAVERVDSHVKERRDFLRTITQLKTENGMLCAALGIPSNAKRPLNKELVKQHIEQLVAHARGICKHHLTAEGVTNESSLIRNSKSCQASFPSDFVNFCHETTEVQKMQRRDNKANVGEISDPGGFHVPELDSQQLPQLLPPVQRFRPFSSLQYQEFNDEDRFDRIGSRCAPTPQQGCNALDILRNLPDTTSTVFTKTRRQVVSTQHLDPAYETGAKGERIATSANAFQKYGFRPRERR